MAESSPSDRVAEIVWKIKTLNEPELAELRKRLADEFALPAEPDELSTREPVRMPPTAESLLKL